MVDSQLTIAGIAVRVSAEPRLLADFLRRTDTYATTGSSDDLKLEVRSDETFEPSLPVRASFPSADAAFIGGRLRFWRRDFDVEITPGSPVTASARCQAGLGVAVENVLRLCLSVMIPLRAGLMLHASAVARNGAGYVFTGPSGAGKSTVVKLLREDGCVRSLGDEVVAIMLTDGEVMVHATPFGGELDPVPPGAAPLRRLFLLDSRANLPHRLGIRCARLLRNALVVASEPSLGQALLTNAQAVLGRVECRVLFRPTRIELERATTG